MSEKVNNAAPTEIIQLFLTPYIEFSAIFGSKDKTLLDCACGNIYQKIVLLDRFKEVAFVDKDIPVHAHSDNESSFYQIDLEKETLPFANRSFDVVFSFETIEHLTEEKQEPFVKELLRVGKTVVIGSVSIDGPNYVGKELIFKKATNTNPYHKKEFASWEWFSFFKHYEKCDFYHLCEGPGGFSIKPGLDGKNGFCNYVVINSF